MFRVLIILSVLLLVFGAFEVSVANFGIGLILASINLSLWAIALKLNSAEKDNVQLKSEE